MKQRDAVVDRGFCLVKLLLAVKFSSDSFRLWEIAGAKMMVKIEGLEIESGSRFQLTQLGAERCSKFVGQTGIIVGFSRANGSIRVLFDGTKTARSLHRTYIEPVLTDARTPALT
jgi:hypothetical protein